MHKLISSFLVASAISLCFLGVLSAGKLSERINGGGISLGLVGVVTPAR